MIKKCTRSQEVETNWPTGAIFQHNLQYCASSFSTIPKIFPADHFSFYKCLPFF